MKPHRIVIRAIYRLTASDKLPWNATMHGSCASAPPAASKSQQYHAAMRACLPREWSTGLPSTER
eukprot:11548776-Prorocentrum_lima.AAC.1